MRSPMRVQWYEQMLADPHLPAHLRAEYQAIADRISARITLRKNKAASNRPVNPKRDKLRTWPELSPYLGEVDPTKPAPWEDIPGETPMWPPLPPSYIRGWFRVQGR